MIRSVLSLGLGALAFAALADLRELPVSEAERAAYDEACAHYEARAEAPPAGRSGAFAGFLAEACSAAGTLLETGAPEQRWRSALLLWRVTELRRAVAGMNADRARRGALPVSPSGEFLIAHRLGVLLAFDAWVETGARVPVASYP